MKTLILALVLVGCSGESFTGVDFTRTAGDAQESDSGVVAVDSGASPADEDGGPSGTGGSTALEKDGGVRRLSAGGSGGAPGSTGGAVNATGGSTGVGGAASGGTTTCTLVTHDNGLGQTWQDCTSLGVYNQAQAMKACGASGAGTCTAINRCGGLHWEVDGYTTDGSHLIGYWMYGGSAAGYVAVEANGSPPCSGSVGANPLWVHMWQ